MAVRKTTSKTIKPSNTKVTKFVRLKRDQQLKDEFGSVFTEVYYGLKKACSTGADVTATDLFLKLDRKIKRKDIAVILDGASWSKKAKAGHYTFYDKILEDRRKKGHGCKQEGCRERVLYMAFEFFFQCAGGAN